MFGCWCAFVCVGVCGGSKGIVVVVMVVVRVVRVGWMLLVVVCVRWSGRREGGFRGQ